MRKWESPTDSPVPEGVPLAGLSRNRERGSGLRPLLAHSGGTCGALPDGNMTLPNVNMSLTAWLHST